MWGKMESFDNFDHDFYVNASHYNNFRNGATVHGTFVGICKQYGTVWEYDSYESDPGILPIRNLPELPSLGSGVLRGFFQAIKTAEVLLQNFRCRVTVL